MNTVAPSLEFGLRGLIPRADAGGVRLELIAFTLLVIVLNLPLFFGQNSAALTFQADAVAQGEWWRLLTHPFVHVSWYHLLLDGAAFLILYANLGESRWRRLWCVGACAAGSLAAAVYASPLIAVHGLCGLSGVAHGMMAFSAAEALLGRGVDRRESALAIASLLGLAFKSILESVTGSAFFAGIHFGLLGTPIVECHAGGVLAGLLAAVLLLSRFPRPTITSGSVRDATSTTAPAR